LSVAERTANNKHAAIGIKPVFAAIMVRKKGEEEAKP